MSVVCLGSGHGSPGVTTTALCLAAVWPQHRRCLLVEADPFGGMIAARYGLGDTPGLSSLAAVARRGLDDTAVWRHTQQIPGGVRVLVGPASADEAHAVLGDLAGPFAAWSAAQTDVDVIVDCGRIGPGSPTGPLLGEGAVLVLARPSVDQLRPAAQRWTALKGSGIDVRLLLVGDRPYRPDEVTETLGAAVAGVIAWDPRTAAVLAGGKGAVRDLRRSPLVRSVATLAAGLAMPPSELDVSDDEDPAGEAGVPEIAQGAPS